MSCIFFSNISNGFCCILIHRPFRTHGLRIRHRRDLYPICRLRAFTAQGRLRGIAVDAGESPRRNFVPSNEQQAIVELCRTQNVVVSARPGAGKTATAEAIAAADPNRPIAVITYSKRLQISTSKRLEGYRRADVFTFHALAGQLFSTVALNDTILRSLREEKKIPAWYGRRYEVIILDEVQDCNDDLFWLTSAFISAVTHAAGGKAPRVVILGDERQAIYGFKGADARYLSLSSSIMTTLSPYRWSHLALSKSFRLSHENAAFVNNVFLKGNQYITGSHNGPKPIYWHGKTVDIKRLGQHLIQLIQKYGPENTAILAPSVRQNKRLSSMTNYMSNMHGIPVAVSSSDDVPLDDRVLRGKVCVSTYHQFKGSERDLVIVYGADAGYFRFIGRDLPDDVCPNDTFVALTRARKQLVLLHDYQNRPMPFIDMAELDKTANVIRYLGGEQPLRQGSPGRPLQLGLLLPVVCSPSDVPRHILDEVIDDMCRKNLRIDQIEQPLPDDEHINAPEVVVTDSHKEHYEAVSDLNGLAIVAAYEHDLLGTLLSLGSSKNMLKEFSLSSNTNEQAVWLCREACRYEGVVSGYESRYLQMKGHSFDWLGPYLDAARKRLRSQFPASAVIEFETKLQRRLWIPNPQGGDDQSTIMRGRADIVRYEKALLEPFGNLSPWTTNPTVGDIMDLDHVSIWEIKFVSQLLPQHAIQACIYAYLWTKQHAAKKPPRIMLFNVRDGEKWEIVPRNGLYSLRNLVEETLVAKYSTTSPLTTEEFLKKCAKTRAEVELSL